MVTTTIAPVQLFLFLHIIWFTQVREVLHIYLMSLQGACECRYPTGKKQSLDEESSCIQYWSDRTRRVGSMSCQCYSNLLCSTWLNIIICTNTKYYASSARTHQDKYSLQDWDCITLCSFGLWHWDKEEDKGEDWGSCMPPPNLSLPFTIRGDILSVCLWEDDGVDVYVSTCSHREVFRSWDWGWDWLADADDTSQKVDRT